MPSPRPWQLPLDTRWLCVREAPPEYVADTRALATRMRGIIVIDHSPSTCRDQKYYRTDSGVHRSLNFGSPR